MKEMHYCVLPRKVAIDRGITRYFTGDPCKRGHFSPRNVSKSDCLECKREKNREWAYEKYQLDPEKYRNKCRARRSDPKKREKEYEAIKNKRQKNIDEFRKRDRAYYWRDPKKRRDSAKKHRVENLHKVNESARKWRESNKEHVLNYHRERHAQRSKDRKYVLRNRVRARSWAQKNPEQKAAQWMHRRAIKIQRTLAFNEELTRFVMQEASRQAKDLEFFLGIEFHVDHIIPMQGKKVSGLNVWYNLQVIPATINISKGNRLIYLKPFEWMGRYT